MLYMQYNIGSMLTIFISFQVQKKTWSFAPKLIEIHREDICVNYSDLNENKPGFGGKQRNVI